MADMASAEGAAAAAAAERKDDDEVVEDLHTPIGLPADIHMYMRSKTVLLEILEIRGFDVSPLVTESPEELKHMAQDDIAKYYMTVKAIDKDSDRVCRVILSKTAQSAMKTVESHLNPEHPDALIPENSEIICLVFGALSDTAIRDIKRKSKSLHIQIDPIHVSNLLFNVLKHDLVPEYTPVLIGSDEEADIIESLSIRSKKQLPVILSVDIISRLLGLRREQLVLVKNRGPGGSTQYIRVCLDR